MKMNKHKKNILKKKVQNSAKRFIKPYYDVREASHSYSNIAALIAGFAFAAVILVVQTIIPTQIPNAYIYRDRATITFLLAFVGCIVSAFVFATVTGEDILSPRSHTIAFLGGIGFSVSSNLVIFGLVILVKIFLSPTIYSFVFYVFPLVMFISPLFVVFSAFDALVCINKFTFTKKDYSKVFVPGFTPLLIAFLIKIFGLGLSNNYTQKFFDFIIGYSIILIIISACSALVISSVAKGGFNLKLLYCGMVLCIHSILIGLIVIIL